MATCAPRTVRAGIVSRNVGPAPALYLTLCLHLAAVAARLRAIRLRGTIRASWRPIDDEVVCFVRVDVDPESDTFLDDERRAARECRAILIDAGFIVGGHVSAEPRPLRVSSYHGAEIARAA